MGNFRKTYLTGVPFTGLKQLLGTPAADQKNINQPGIPVMDSANNQLAEWIKAAKEAFAGQELKYLIKGDAKSKYPAFEGVISALKRNNEFKYNLVTSLDEVPPNSALDKANKTMKK
jgi:hypothetical protein